MKREIIKNGRGITLIALVVTIIVLIILAGISINLILGENGIIQRTKDAKEQSLIAQYKEQIDLIKTETEVKNEGNIILEKLNEAFNENNQKYWVNNTEITDSIIKLTTNDGYVFFITESTTEYKGTGEVIIPEIISAEMVEFTPDSSLNWTGITNVKQALDYLYEI